MTDLRKKLNPKAQGPVVVIGSPASFAAETALWPEVHLFQHLESSLCQGFVLAFVKNPTEVSRIAAHLSADQQPELLLWLAYPKKISPLANGDIDRDHGWESLREKGFRPVSQIAIDEDWSALRFRPAKAVKIRQPARA